VYLRVVPDFFKSDMLSSTLRLLVVFSDPRFVVLHVLDLLDSVHGFPALPAQSREHPFPLVFFLAERQ